MDQESTQEFYTRNGWKGSRYNGNLSIKEIALLIRNELKLKYPSLIFSVTKETYSGGCSLHISLMESNIKIIKDFKEIPQEAFFKYEQNRYTKEQIQKTQSERYHQLNHHFEEYNPLLWCNGVFLTEEGHNILKDVANIANSFNYDDSNSMLDYFSTNFYLHLNIGKFDKPFIQNIK